MVEIGMLGNIIDEIMSHYLYSGLELIESSADNEIVEDPCVEIACRVSEDPDTANTIYDALRIIEVQHPTPPHVDGNGYFLRPGGTYLPYIKYPNDIYVPMSVTTMSSYFDYMLEKEDLIPGTLESEVSHLFTIYWSLLAASSELVDRIDVVREIVSRHIIPSQRGKV